MKHWDGSNWTGTDWDAGDFRGPNGEAPPGTMRASLAGSASVSGFIDFVRVASPVKPPRVVRSRVITRRRPKPAPLRASLGGGGALAGNGRLDWTEWHDDEELGLLLAA